MNTKDNRGHTALIWAVNSKNSDMVASLMRREELDVNARNSDGLTALMLAVAHNAMDIVLQLLISVNIDVNAKMNDGRSALLLAHSLNHQEIVKILIYLDAMLDIDISGEDRSGPFVWQQAVFFVSVSAF